MTSKFEPTTQRRSRAITRRVWFGNIRRGRLETGPSMIRWIMSTTVFTDDGAPRLHKDQQKGKQHAQVRSDVCEPDAADSEMVSGVVMKIDESTGKITLKHDPIKSLGMDEGMTMVWSVQDNTLKGVKAGDKVRFRAENINGQLTVTKIEKAK